MQAFKIVYLITALLGLTSLKLQADQFNSTKPSNYDTKEYDDKEEAYSQEDDDYRYNYSGESDEAEQDDKD